MPLITGDHQPAACRVCVSWQQRRESPELLFGQPEIIAIHPCSLPLRRIPVVSVPPLDHCP